MKRESAETKRRSALEIATRSHECHAKIMEMNGQGCMLPFSIYYVAAMQIVETAEKGSLTDEDLKNMMRRSMAQVELVRDVIQEEEAAHYPGYGLAPMMPEDWPTKQTEMKH